MKSLSLADCKAREHNRVSHSPDGVNRIEECPECCRAWLLTIGGEEIRLHGSYEARLAKQKLSRQ